jgi:hypothetical protein
MPVFKLRYQDEQVIARALSNRNVETLTVNCVGWQF